MMWIALLALACQDPPTSAVQTLLVVEEQAVDLALRDMDGDGDLDLVRVSGKGLDVYPLQDSGLYATEPQAHLSWPAKRTAWTLGDISQLGHDQAILLTEDGRVHAWVLRDGQFEQGPPLISGKCYLPPGVSAMEFARDVNSDGRRDLVLPTRAAHHVYLASPSGFADPLQIAYDLSVTVSVGNPTQLGARVGRRVAIPWFRMEDVDGDGLIDLISQTRERVSVHLDGENGVPTEPSWILDLAALRATLPKLTKLNLDDLFSNIEDEVTWKLREIDGKAPKDLLVAVGPEVFVYLGGARTGPRETPDQKLKSSGKILGWFVRQVREGPLPELQIARGESISLSSLLRFLVLPGSLDFELFTYTNDQGAFSRRPTQRGRVAVEIPNILSLIDKAGDMSDEVLAQLEIPARRLNWGGDAERSDVLDAEGDTVSIYLDCAPREQRVEQAWKGEPDVLGLLEILVLEDLDKLGDDGDLTLSFESMMKRDFSPGSALRRSHAERTPDFSQTIQGLAEAEQVILLPHDLSASGSDDLIICTREDGQWTVRAWLSGL